jgi:hypothetical protein
VASAKTQIGIDSISSATGTGSSVSWSHTVGAGSDRILVVGISKRKNDKTTNNITYGGVGGFTQVGSQIGSGTDHGVEIWYKLAPAVGTANIVVTLSGNVNAAIGAISFIGVNQTTPTGTFAGAGGTDASPIVNVSSAGGELVLGVLSISGDHGGITAGGGQTVRWSGSTGTGDSNEYGAGDTAPGASSVTMSWSAVVANKWAVGGVSLKPA